MPASLVSPAHWHVLGAGAMGCLFAYQLHNSGHPVTLVLRQRTKESTLRVLVECNGRSYKQQLPVCTAADTGKISHLLVTTKAYDVYAGVMALAHRLDGNSQILVLANGMGYADNLSADLPCPSYYFGTTTQGAYRIAARHIRHAGQGPTRIGSVALNAYDKTTATEQPPSWFEPWSKAIRPSTWDTNIEQALWLKLAINCAINPLTALHNCPNGELAREPELASEVEQLCYEIQQISAAAGFSAITRDLHRAVAQVIADTADNRSSMLQDVLARRRTEIDYITGQLLRVAEQYAIPAPANTSLLKRVQVLDH